MILERMPVEDRPVFNELCKDAYERILPNNIVSVQVDQPIAEEKDILKWRHNKFHKKDKYLRRMIVKRRLNQVICGIKGTYYGEW